MLLRLHPLGDRRCPSDPSAMILALNLTAIGTYGADYLHRAGIATGALGANVVEDAVYPTAFVDAEGQPFSSDKRYVLHFAKDQIPRARFLVVDDV
jgi:hypothetical protein